MANNATIAHRFANRDYNFERGLKGSSTHISGNNYYSYSTVFGQWVDEKLCIVYWGGTSSTSQSHKLYQWNFPKDVVLLPYDDKWDNNGNGFGYSYGYYHGCNLIGYKEFTYEHRVELIDYYVHKIYTSLNAIVDGKSKGLEEHAESIISEYWGYVMKLCALYRDTTISKWLRKKRVDLDGVWKLKKKLVKELDAQNMDVKSLVDIAFGKGTWEKYYNYCERYRKADNKRAQMSKLCNRLGIKNPYEGWQGYSVLSHDMSAADIRNLTAKERNDLHFASIMHKEWIDGENERKEKYNKNFRNAYKWIVGFEPKKKSWGGGYENDVHNNCVNKDNGVVYECSGDYIYRFYWCNTSVSFDYDEFRKSEDKEQWIAEFYAKCKEVALNRKAISIIKRINAHKKEKKHSYDDDVYLNDDYLRNSTTEAEYIICSEFISKQDKYFADEEARRRAEEIERLRREEEKRKEKELQAQIRREQINECLENGVDGCRDLWRKHYVDIYEAKQYADDIDGAIPFYFGGNVLMRFSMNKDKVETSKSIRVTIPTCKLMWKLVCKWHENPSSFKPMQIKTLDGTYTIISYENDILTAGCHDIAYAEMERMYKEIIANEEAA